MMTAEVTVTGQPASRSGGMSAARPPLIRALNEQLLLGHIRQLGPCSRADLARLSGLSKPTVSLALAAVERAADPGRRPADRRAGPVGSAVRGPARRRLRLGLDVGAQYLRGAVADLAGTVRARGAARLHAASVRGRIDELVQLAGSLCAEAGLDRSAITQAVIGSPASTTRSATRWR